MTYLPQLSAEQNLTSAPAAAARRAPPPSFPLPSVTPLQRRPSPPPSVSPLLAARRGRLGEARRRRELRPARAGSVEGAAAGSGKDRQRREAR